MPPKLRTITIAAIAAVIAASALAHQKAKPDVEGQIRAACFRCFLSTILGDSDEYLKVARIPLALIKDGVLTHRDEKATKALLSQIAERGNIKALSADDKAQIAKNMIAIFDDAAV